MSQTHTRPSELPEMTYLHTRSNTLPCVALMPSQRRHYCSALRNCGATSRCVRMAGAVQQARMTPKGRSARMWLWNTQAARYTHRRRREKEHLSPDLSTALVSMATNHVSLYISRCTHVKRIKWPTQDHEPPCRPIHRTWKARSLIRSPRRPLRPPTHVYLT